MLPCMNTVSYTHLDVYKRQMAARLDDLVTKALVFRNMSAEKVWLQYGLYVGTRVLDLVLCIAFIAIAIGLINKAYIYKKDEMSVKEMVMLIAVSYTHLANQGET